MKPFSGLLVQLLIVGIVTAQNPSVVLLRGDSTCGSGFVYNNRIITNAHLVSSLCPLGDCSGLKVSEIECSKWSVDSIKRSLDLGALTCSEPISKPGLTLGSSKTSSVTIVGFPRCGAQKTSTGEVIQESRLHLTLTAKGDFGSSGSPILDSDGNLIGIIDQAASAKSLLRSKILLQSEFPMRGVRAENLRYLKGPYLEEISHVLLDYYRQTVRNFSGIDRLLLSFDFLARIEGFNIDVVESGEAPLLIGYLEQIPHATRYSSLILAASLEGRGPYFKPFKPLTDETKSKIISRNEHFQELYAGLEKNPYAGLELTIIKYALILLLIALTIGIVLGIVGTTAVGYIRRRING
jgi:hypothetical protein